jgi:hypothetical protein
LKFANKYPAADRTVDKVPFVDVSFFWTAKRRRPDISESTSNVQDLKLLEIDYEDIRTEVINQFLIDFLKTRRKFVQEKTYIFDCEFWSTCLMKVMLISFSIFFTIHFHISNDPNLS